MNLFIQGLAGGKPSGALVSVLSVGWRTGGERGVGRSPRAGREGSASGPAARAGGDSNKSADRSEAGSSAGASLAMLHDWVVAENIWFRKYLYLTQKYMENKKTEPKKSSPSSNRPQFGGSNLGTRNWGVGLDGCSAAAVGSVDGLSLGVGMEVIAGGGEDDRRTMPEGI